MSYYVYILANKTNVTLYTGVTNDLPRRVYEHRMHLDPSSFSARYHTEKLVYFESVGEATNAIAREKQIKSWNRKRKNTLIEQTNPQWEDLYKSLF